MTNRIIRFRAWDKEGLFMKTGGIQILNSDGTLQTDGKSIVMQFTGLTDKNGVAEIYEGDIIDSEGNIKGNIYESPQIYKEGADCLIAGMGTKEWRNTESVAMGRGCKYAE